MTGKHVHWAPSMTYHSPPPTTPSPSHSEGTLPSTSSLATPPSALRHILSPSGKSPISVHTLIHYNANPPPLRWDVTKEPSLFNIRSANPRIHLSPADLVQPATNPSRMHLTVQCGSITWWKPVDIIVAGMQQFVTVSDVLTNVYQYLQRTISVEEFDQFAHVPGLQNDVLAAFHERCNRIDRERELEPSLSTAAGAQPVSERRKGLKRVDCLLGENAFIGVTRAGDDPRHWLLHVSRR